MTLTSACRSQKGCIIFVALPTGFGKSLTFQLLRSVYKALQGGRGGGGGERACFL